MSNREKGFSLIELLIVVAIILVIAAIAIPNLLRAQMAANESSAVGSLRTLVTAEETYNSSWGIGYSTNLANLGGALPCVASPATACLIDPVLAGGTKSGYTINAIGGAAAGGVVPTYVDYAVPVSVGQTGQRGFCSDESGVVRYDTTGLLTPATDVACQAESAMQ